MADELPLSGLQQWLGPSASPWLIVNKFMRIYEGMAERASIEDRDLTEAPATCFNGARYLVDGPTTLGDPWDNHQGELAIALGTNAESGWYFIPIEREGFELYVRDEVLKLIYQSGAWVPVAIGTVAAGDVNYTPADEGFYPSTVEQALDQLFAMIETFEVLAQDIAYNPIDPGFYSSNVRDVLDEIIAAIGTLSEQLQSISGGGGGGSGYDEGTAFPGSPSNGDMFYKTDFGVAGALFRYVSAHSRWMSAPITEPFESQSALTPTAATFSQRKTNSYFGVADIFIERVSLNTLNSSANTTLNYFSAQPLTLDGAVNNNIGSAILTQGATQNQWTNHSSTPNVVVASTVDGIGIDWTEVGAVTGIHFAASVTYRVAIAG